MSKKVFISYSMPDQHKAELLASELKEQGIPTFIDLHDLIAGESWEERIRKEIQSASYFVVLISKDFIRSHLGMQELGAAIATGIDIIPVLIGDAEFPFDLSKYQYLDMRGGNIQNAMTQLRKTVTPLDK